MRQSLPSGFALTLLLLAPVALAWSLNFPIHATVNGHVFDRVRVDSDDCKLKVRLDFAAPDKGYDSRAKNRNHHRFKARLLFGNGKAVVTKSFNNRSPGRRMYQEAIDTSDEACWGKSKVQLKDVEVVGCRGDKCEIPKFERVLPDYGH